MAAKEQQRCLMQIRYQNTDDDKVKSRFVGLLVDGSTLCLPIGFPAQDPEEPTTNQGRKAWFEHRRLIRNVLRRFYEDEFKRLGSDPLEVDSGSSPGEASRILVKPPSMADGQAEAALRPSRAVVLSHLQRDKAFDRLVDWMQRPEVRAVRSRQGWIDGFDARHLHRAWPRAMFTDDGPVFDGMPGPQRRVQDDPQQAVLALAAWLVRDAVINLEGTTLQNAMGGMQRQVDMQAQAFAAGQGLSPDNSLFVSEAEVVKKVHRRLAAVLEDARKRQATLLPAVRELLRHCDAAVHFQTTKSADGVFGIKGFWPVWEALCADWALNHPEKALPEGEAVFCWDTQQPTQVKSGQTVTEETSDDRLEKVFEHNEKARRPDLVTSKCGTRVSRIIDYKYYSSKARWLRQSRKELENSAADSDGEPARDKKVVDSLEAYRLLAVIYNANHGLVASATDVPIELWLPGQPHKQSVDAAVLPNLTVCYLCPQQLMASYVKDWRRRM